MVSKKSGSQPDPNRAWLEKYKKADIDERKAMLEVKEADRKQALKQRKATAYAQAPYLDKHTLGDDTVYLKRCVCCQDHQHIAPGSECYKHAKTTSKNGEQKCERCEGFTRYPCNIIYDKFSDTVEHIQSLTEAFLAWKKDNSELPEPVRSDFTIESLNLTSSKGFELEKDNDGNLTFPENTPEEYKELYKAVIAFKHTPGRFQKRVRKGAVKGKFAQKD